MELEEQCSSWKNSTSQLKQDIDEMKHQIDQQEMMLEQGKEEKRALQGQMQNLKIYTLLYMFILFRNIFSFYLF